MTLVDSAQLPSACARGILGMWLIGRVFTKENPVLQQHSNAGVWYEKHICRIMPTLIASISNKRREAFVFALIQEHAYSRTCFFFNVASLLVVVTCFLPNAGP